MKGMVNNGGSSSRLEDDARGASHQGEGVQSPSPGSRPVKWCTNPDAPSSSSSRQLAMSSGTTSSSSSPAVTGGSMAFSSDSALM